MTRVARLVRTRRKKDAAFGKYLHVGVAFLLLTFLWRSKEKEVPRWHEAHG